jgi:hypothetical protein
MDTYSNSIMMIEKIYLYKVSSSSPNKKSHLFYFLFLSDL